jgi:hypothetical protein
VSAFCEFPLDLCICINSKKNASVSIQKKSVLLFLVTTTDMLRSRDAMGSLPRPAVVDSSGYPVDLDEDDDFDDGDDDDDFEETIEDDTRE